MAITVNGKVVAFKATKTVVGLPVGNKKVYPKVRLNSIDGGLKGYSIPYKCGDEGLFDSKCYAGNHEIVASILRSNVDGNRIAVVIGRVDWNTGRWKWCKSLSSEKVNMVEDTGYDAVELKSDPADLDIISLDFYDQKSGVSVMSKFNSLTGAEIIV